MSRELRPFVWITALLIAAALVIEVANGRFWVSDFRVYWSAANALVNGQQVYGIAFGENTGFYKYAPAVALAFVPASWLPFPLAAAVHVLLIGVALVISVVELERTLMRHVLLAFAPRILLRALLLLVAIAVLLARELHLGNINLWLVAGVIVAIRKLLEDDDMGAGVLLGVVWFVKPYLLLMAVLLVIRRKWAVLLAAVIVWGVALALPFALLGPCTAWDLHVQWLQAMLSHSAYLTSPNTLSAMLANWSGGMEAGAHPKILIGLAMALLAWAAWKNRHLPSGTMANTALCLELWVAMAVVPNLVITDQEHFLFSLPLIAWVLAHLFRTQDPWVGFLFVLAMVLYATRSSDLWGSALEDRMAALGALGLGNVLLMASAVLAGGRRAA
jgi:Glycosyltransferase family 87